MRLVLRTGGDLVAAVPLLLGFHPTDSLVVVALCEQTDTGRVGIGVTLRTDLGGPDVVAEQVAQLVGSLRRLISDAGCSLL